MDRPGSWPSSVSGSRVFELAAPQNQGCKSKAVLWQENRCWASQGSPWSPRVMIDEASRGARKAFMKDKEHMFTKETGAAQAFERENRASAKGRGREMHGGPWKQRIGEGTWLSLGEQQKRGRIWEAKSIIPGSLDCPGASE